MTMTTAILTAPLMELPPAAPSAFRILRAGLNPTEKGGFIFDQVAADMVMAAYAAKGLDKIQIDFEHQSLQAPPAGGDAAKPAAGWFRPEVRDGELWATAVTWTLRALTMLVPERGAPEYRYFSPILHFDETTRRVIGLKNIALTNDPAMDEQTPLVAATAGLQPATKEIPMKTAALTAEDRVIARLMGNDLKAVEAFKIKQFEEEELERGGVVALSSHPGQTVSLTAEDRRIAKMFGHSLRDVAAFKLQQELQQEEKARRGY